MTVDEKQGGSAKMNHCTQPEVLPPKGVELVFIDSNVCFTENVISHIAERGTSTRS